MNAQSCMGLRSESRGMTLLEVMIALAIFSVGILAVAAMQNVGMAAFAKARQGSDYSRLAAARIEEILSLDYDDPSIADRDNGYYPENPDHGPVEFTMIRATVEWEVDDDFPVPDTKRISMTVRPQANGQGSAPFVYDYVKARNMR